MRPERVVIEVSHERVHDRPANGGDEHRGRNARVRVADLTCNAGEGARDSQIVAPEMLVPGGFWCDPSQAGVV